MSDDLVSRLGAETPEVEELRRRVFDLERRLSAQGDTEKRARDAEGRIAKLEKELGILAGIGDRLEPPRWLTKPPRSSSQHHAIAWLMLSDLHLDEVVEPDQVMGSNAYNRDIAVQRLGKTFQNFVKVTRDNWTSIHYDGVIMPLGGDIFSGDIHEELKESNEDTILGSLDFWLDHLASGISLLAEGFERVHIPVVVGNHGRMTRKPRAKFRARSNFDWFVGRALQRMFANDKRVTFDVSESADCLVECYSQRVMLTHGDQASGGQGIGGIWPPIMRLNARKRQRQEAVGRRYDLLIMGHWHSLVFGPDFIVNGSLKGQDEYAHIENFGFEPPRQAAWLMTPEHGVTWTAPIFSQDREAEGW